MFSVIVFAAFPCLHQGKNKDIYLCVQANVSLLIRNNGILPQYWLHHHLQRSLREMAENRYCNGLPWWEKEKEREMWGGEGEASCVFAHGKGEVTSKSCLSLEAGLKRCSCCHTGSLLGHLCDHPAPLIETGMNESSNTATSLSFFCLQLILN